MILLDPFELPHDAGGPGDLPLQVFPRLLKVAVEAAPCLLTAERSPGNECVRFVLLNDAEVEAVIETCIGEAFRPILAAFGHQLLGDQLYGGAARRLVQWRGMVAPIAVFMGNDGLTGNWLRLSVGLPRSVDTSGLGPDAVRR